MAREGKEITGGHDPSARPVRAVCFERRFRGSVHSKTAVVAMIVLGRAHFSFLGREVLVADYQLYGGLKAHQGSVQK
jgi:hypothetical protein